MKRVIYDFGANIGNDIPYYLKKADLVVAVEANPKLTDRIKDKFADAIRSGRLIVENCVLNCEGANSDVSFFIHNRNHALSQFPPPKASSMSEFSMVRLPSCSPHEIVARHGDPYYIKVDIEHYDHVVLNELFSHRVFPPYISAEFHSFDVFHALTSQGQYKAFKIVEGVSVCEEYKRIRIKNAQGEEELFSFPYHCAGPFGEDLKGEWVGSAIFSQYLGAVGVGWKDIHASRLNSPNPSACIHARSASSRALQIPYLIVKAVHYHLREWCNQY